ncbi:dethiobiotin synthase [Halovivax asiaticus JCM 14624]|uniref:ATP-dependent dethiobiotin synthetase BioD n=1 Tax=Halovivax asiaticus JCM 14624 TaxID=1227490 RepID=M0BM47_9EURY|nr:dethiobiotin synthase [Halovivax asiaticus]ELZ11532.1 dethiobiotin synthase [Halovivax asiaticus JCM 14624]
MTDRSLSASRDFAVVGTDTGVGKTVVTAGLVGWLRDDGVDARAIKPCQTGHPPDDDAEFVGDACGDPAAATCLRRLEPALAPAVAARQANADLGYERIRDGCRDALEAASIGVVEGIGGLRVPLSDGREVVDLIADLELPALVVARSGLGTLNHSALTVEALERRGIEVHGIVLNEYEGADVAERTNPSVLASMTERPVWTLAPISTDRPGTVPAAVEDALDPDVFPH